MPLTCPRGKYTLAMPISPRHFGTLDILRGVAALAVALFHLSRQEGDAFSWVLNHGHYGVEMFFVISGFVIPLSMQRSGYQLPRIGSFLTRRVMRLYPVFFVVLLISIANTYFGKPALAYAPHPEQITWPRFWANATMTA